MTPKPLLHQLAAICLVLFLIACNNSTSKKDKPAQDTGTTAPAAKPPVENTANNTPQEAEKCFTNQGLKYETVITITREGNKVRGKVTSTELDTNKPEQATFTGTAEGNTLTISFTGNAPVVGASSEWTTKPWVMEAAAGSEKLLIPFNAKNYETNKWQEMVYEFLPCGK